MEGAATPPRAVLIKGPTLNSKVFMTAMPSRYDDLLAKACELIKVPADHTPQLYVTCPASVGPPHSEQRGALLMDDAMPFLRDRELVTLRWTANDRPPAAGRVQWDPKLEAGASSPRAPPVPGWRGAQGRAMHVARVLERERVQQEDRERAVAAKPTAPAPAPALHDAPMSPPPSSPTAPLSPEHVQVSPPSSPSPAPRALAWDADSDSDAELAALPVSRAPAEAPLATRAGVRAAAPAPSAGAHASARAGTAPATLADEAPAGASPAGSPAAKTLAAARRADTPSPRSAPASARSSLGKWCARLNPFARTDEDAADARDATQPAPSSPACDPPSASPAWTATGPAAYEIMTQVLMAVREHPRNVHFQAPHLYMATWDDTTMALGVCVSKRAFPAAAPLAYFAQALRAFFAARLSALAPVSAAVTREAETLQALAETLMAELQRASAPAPPRVPPAAAPLPSAAPKRDAPAAAAEAPLAKRTRRASQRKAEAAATMSRGRRARS